MKTVTYNDILFRAAELAGRTRDKLPTSEATMLQGFLAVDLEDVWNSQAWPELVPDPIQVTVTNQEFSKNEGSEDPAAPEMGDILGVTTNNPLVTTKYRNVEFEEADDVVRVLEPLGSVWVEYMLPAPDLMSITDPTALAGTTIPKRFSNYLALSAAAKLLAADGQAGSAAAYLTAADSALKRQVQRLVVPARRSGARLRSAGSVRCGTGQ